MPSTIHILSKLVLQSKFQISVSVAHSRVHTDIFWRDASTCISYYPPIESTRIGHASVSFFLFEFSLFSERG